MKKFTLISPRSYGSGLPLAGVSSKQGTMLSPPQSLMDFCPMSQLTNHIIAGLNELRQCAAIGVSASVHRQLVVVMECVIHELWEYLRCVLHILCCVCSYVRACDVICAQCIVSVHVCMCLCVCAHMC